MYIEMNGINVFGVDYMYICDDNQLKKLSLEDNVHFTLRDIFCNAQHTDTMMEADSLLMSLTNNVCYENRDKNFKYVKVLYQVSFLERFYDEWLKHFTKEWFTFEYIEEGEEYINMSFYMKFDDWWEQFEELRELMKERYYKLLQLEHEDLVQKFGIQPELYDEDVFE